ncbi:V-type ATP synthase subunit I [Alkalibacterium iburiense]|uniref:V-type ATP synthase subunit I n=1 Tax=Alkalibacterium iburiense TaxID=290589 RepID=A0ABN0X0T1_9LACT
MAIAKMKKLTLLAEHKHKETLLKSVQEMQSLEIIPIAEKLEEALLENFETATSPVDQSDFQSTLQDIEYAIDYLEGYVSQPGLFEKLKSKRDVLTLNELEQHIESIDTDALINQVTGKEKALNDLEEEIKDLKQEEDFLRKWRPLKFLPEEVANFRFMHVIAGSLDSEHEDPLIDSLKENGKIYFEEIFRRRDQVAYLMIMPKSEKESFSQIITQYSFRELNYQYDVLPEDALYRNLKTQKEKYEALEAHKKEMKKWKDVYRNLELSEEYYYNISERERAKSLFIDSQHLFLLTGWIEASKADSLIQNVWDTIGESEVAILTDDIEVEEYKEVPIVFENHKLVRPFEMITEMFSYPKYDGIDPTPHMMPFFVVFFGMMSADLGYGILLFAITLLSLKAFNLGSGAERFMKFLHVNSYATIGFGLFFGSFFGAELPFNVLSLQDDILVVMGLSVVLGLIQLIYGLILTGVMKSKQNDKASSYVDGFAWAMILVGIILWVVGSMVWDSPLLSQAGIILAVINVVGILIVSMISNSNKALGLGLGAYNIYGVTGYIGDVVSYTRLMALAVASANIGMAFNMIVGLLPPIARFTVGLALIAVLHGLNIGLTFLSAYVHSSRLQYVEFFGKFYEGGGRPLSPFKTLEKHIFIKND